MIRAAGLVVSLGDRRVVDGLDLDIAAGGLVCVVGPNGAGKTTLLRTLAGELDPSEGTVTVDGHRPHRLPISERARIRAFLGQTERADIPYPVRTVVGFGTHLSTLDRRAQAAMVESALVHLEIGHLAERRVASLSGGERRRVAIARTLAQDASVSLLDEPTDSLDMGHADLVLGHLAGLARSGRTVVATSHDLNLAARHGERILVMEGGRIVADGSATDVLVEDLLSTVYRCPVRVMPHPEDGCPIVFL